MQTTPIVIALPGFTRGPGHLVRLANACASEGYECLRPALAPRWLPVLYMVPSHLRSIARRLGEAVGGSPIVVVGHSAGGAAGTSLAADLSAGGANVRGLVLIDGVESPNRLIATRLGELDGLRIAAVLAPPSPCNRHSQLEDFLAGYPNVRVEVVPGAGHGDIEGAGIGVYRRMCKDTSDEATADLVLARVMRAIDWVLTGDDDAHSHH